PYTTLCRSRRGHVLPLLPLTPLVLHLLRHPHHILLHRLLRIRPHLLRHHILHHALRLRTRLPPLHARRLHPLPHLRGLRPLQPRAHPLLAQPVHRPVPVLLLLPLSPLQQLLLPRALRESLSPPHLLAAPRMIPVRPPFHLPQAQPLLPAGLLPLRNPPMV